MKISGKHWRSLWFDEAHASLIVIDQTKLPHLVCTKSLDNFHEVALAIKDMVIRGAPLIGVAGAYGIVLALIEDPNDIFLENAFQELLETRPTAINLKWALKLIYANIRELPLDRRVEKAKELADLIAEKDVMINKSIANFGSELLKRLAQRRPKNRIDSTFNILTHCNAGWLATIDWGTALAPIYMAHRAGLNIHVWVDETRPRNQGAKLTSFELENEGIPHTLIVDNAAGYLMQNGKVDAVIVGADRITRSGDVCNKIGTYLKALSARDNHLPFLVAAPIATIDWSLESGIDEIPIEVRSPNEITQIEGLLLNSQRENKIEKLLIAMDGVNAFNPAFDITPSELVTNFITEQGLIPNNLQGLSQFGKDFLIY